METVYKLTIEGTSCIFFIIEDAFTAIKEHEFDNYEKTGDPINCALEILEMSEKELSELQEFDGF